MKKKKMQKKLEHLDLNITTFHTLFQAFELRIEDMNASMATQAQEIEDLKAKVTQFDIERYVYQTTLSNGVHFVPLSEASREVGPLSKIKTPE